MVSNMQTDHTPQYTKNSLSLFGTVSMGTGVMIGAGIFALTGQIAEYAGTLFPVAFILAAVVSYFSAYTYIKMSSKYPSAGGIGMILHKAYGHSTITGACALLMAFSMIINESLVARTFATYTTQLFEISASIYTIPALSVALVFLAFLVNLSGNSAISIVSKITAVIKIVGILVFAFAVLWINDALIVIPSDSSQAEFGFAGFLAGTALAVLAFKGFTTITNSGGEVTNPTKNIGRAILISLAICLAVYLSVALAINGALTLPEIIAAKDFALAEAARPLFGNFGLTFTVFIAIIATSSGILASMFAVSRMLTMLTNMRLIPHRHFGMPGDLQKHLLVYTAVLAGLLAALFDLSRIAALGAIYYLVMDIAIHWGVFRNLRKDVDANPFILISAIILDLIVLVAFLWIKGTADPFIVIFAITSMIVIVAFEFIYLHTSDRDPAKHDQ